MNVLLCYHVTLFWLLNKFPSVITLNTLCFPNLIHIYLFSNKWPNLLLRKPRSFKASLTQLLCIFILFYPSLLKVLKGKLFVTDFTTFYFTKYSSVKGSETQIHIWHFLWVLFFLSYSIIVFQLTEKDTKKYN